MLALAGLGALCSGLGTLSRWADDPGATALALVLSTVIAAPYLLVLLWVDRHEPEPWWLVLSALAWGAIGASGLSAIGNDTFGLLLQVGGASEGVAGFLTASLSAPFVEESAKGLALLALLALFRRELHGVIDGILYGALIGLGFEWLENLWYYVKVSDDGPLAMIRLACMRGLLGSPGTHAAWTAITGAGVGWWRAHPTRPLRWFVVPVALGLAMGGHFVWNSFAWLFFGDVSLEHGVGAIIAYAEAAAVLQTPTLLFLLVIVVLAWRSEDALLRAHLAGEPADVVGGGDAALLLPARRRYLRVFSAIVDEGLGAGLRRRALGHVLIRLAYARWVHAVDAPDWGVGEDADVSALRAEVRRLRGAGAAL